MVATAYMEEAARFDWLVAMDAGRVLATGNASELLARTGAATLDAAFIALLPEEKRRGHIAVEVTPRPEGAAVPLAIDAEGLTQRFGDFTAVDHVSFRIERGEIFGFLGSNGCGKTTTMKMMTGLLPPTEGPGTSLWQGDEPERHRAASAGRLYVAGLLTLYRTDGQTEPASCTPACSAAAGEDSARVAEMRAISV